MTRRQCQEGTCLDRIFLVGRRAGGDGAALLGDVLRVSDLGEGADVVEAVGDLLDGYEGEDAWEMVSGADSARLVEEGVVPRPSQSQWSGMLDAIVRDSWS